MKIEMENINRYMLENIDILIEGKKLEDKRIVLFGLNTSSYAAREYLEKKGFRVCAYIDNDRKKVDELNDIINEILPVHMQSMAYEFAKKEFIRAYNPENLLKEFCDDYVILIASKYYSQMCEQLENMGYKEGKHIYQIVDFYSLEQQLKDFKVADDYIPLSHEEVRKYQLEILDEVKRVCEQNNLRYYLCGGTLLGAIRHKGYIPWDDDIDVIMPYQDYLKFIEIIDKDNEHYTILSPYTNKEQCFTFFARMIHNDTFMKWWEYPFLMTSGVSIDIFALSGLPDSEDEIRFYYNKVRRLNTKFISSYLKLSYNDNDEIQAREKIRSEILEMLERYRFDDSKKAFCITKYKEKDILPTSIYDKTIKVNFEDRIYDVAGGYDIYLKSLYGDYMKLPPVNQRTGCHNYKAYKIREN